MRMLLLVVMVFVIIFGMKPYEKNMFLPLNLPPSSTPPTLEKTQSSASTLYSKALVQNLKKPGSGNCSLHSLSRIAPVDPSSRLISGLALSNIATSVRDLARAADLLPAPLHQRMLVKLVRGLLDEGAFHTAYTTANLLAEGDERCRFIGQGLLSVL
jgi:hypothetical protein